MCNVEKRKKLAAMLRGNDAMKNYKMVKLNRIALISIAAAALMACSSVTAFAADSSTLSADTSTRVIYTGNGTTTTTVEVKNADDLDTFKNLMPGDSTNPQNIIIENQSSQNMRVYFNAEPTDLSAQNVLDALQLKITFKMDDKSTPLTLYDGPASGKAGNAAGTASDIVTKQSLGYVYGKSTSGVLSATLTAPETMDNQYQLAKANIKWVFQFELADPISSLPHNNGGGGGGGNTIQPTPLESIGTESVPQAEPTVSSAAPEEIANEDVPLSNPPKTGQDATVIWIVLALAISALIVFTITRIKMKHTAQPK